MTLPSHDASPTVITELIVCTTCRQGDGPRSEPATGELLLQALCDLGGEHGLRVRGQACLSACSQACTVALQANGKYTYVFGGLTPESSTAEQVLVCARRHRDSPDGLLAWSARPERLRRGIVARIMPLEREAGGRQP